MTTPDDDDLLQQLVRLTRDLDQPGADLHAMLSVLTDDISAAAPSFLGLRLTLDLEGASTIVNAIDPEEVNAARASLLLPLFDIDPSGPVGSVILFAAAPGAFDELADYTRRSYSLDGQVAVDQHLPVCGDPKVPRGVSGIEAASLVNIAIGVLIDRGYLHDEARAELIRRAGSHDGNVMAAAREIIGTT